MSDIQFVVSSDSRQAQRDLANLNKSVADISAVAQSTSNSLASLAKSVAATIAGAGILAGLKSSADGYTKLTNQIKLATGATTDYVTAQEELIKVAINSKSQVATVSLVFQGLARSLNAPRAGILKVTEAIQKAGIISGGSAESINAAMVQLNQGLQAGALRGEELNSVMEQTPAIARAIAAGMGVSIGQLRALAEQGKLTSDAVYTALLSQADAINKEFESISITIGDSLKLAREAASITIGESMDVSGMTSAISGAFSALAKSLQESRSFIVENVADMRLGFQLFKMDVDRVGAAIAPMIRQIGKEINRVVPVVSLLQLNLGSKIATTGLLAWIEAVAFLQNQTLQAKIAVRQLFTVFGADYKSDFLDSLRDLVYSRTIPEIEKSLGKLYSSIKDNDLTTFGGWFDLLSGDQEIGTALLDAVDFKGIISSLMPLREMLASLGLLENKLIAIGNIRFDKFESLSIYLSTAIEFVNKFATAIFTDLIQAFTYLTTTTGSYFIEASKQFSGVTQSVLKGVGRFIYQLSGFSAVINTTAITVIDTLSKLGAAVVAFGTTNINLDLGGVRKAVSYLVSEGPSAIKYAKTYSEKEINELADFITLQLVIVTQKIKEGMWKHAYVAFWERKFFSGNYAKSVTDKIKDVAAEVSKMNISIPAINLSDTFTTVYAYASKYLALTLEKLSRFKSTVLAYFYDIWDKVVGHSYWPDMIDGVNNYTSKLFSGALAQVNKFRESVNSSFSKIKANIDFSNLFGDTSKLEVLGRLVGSAILVGLTAALLLPGSAFTAFAAFMSYQISGEILSAINNATKSYLDISVYENVGKSLGNLVGTFISRAISQIPSVIGNMIDFAGAFINSFLSELGIVGNAIKGIINLFTLGNVGAIPLFIFGYWGVTKLIATLDTVKKTLGSVLDIKPKDGGTPLIEKISKSIFGSMDQKYLAASVAALMTSISSEISLFRAGLTATPLMVMAILGDDVAGKIISDSAKMILAKMMSYLVAFKASAIGLKLSGIFESITGDKSSSIKDGLRKTFSALKSVLDTERKELYKSGKINLSEFLFGDSKVYSNKFSMDAAKEVSRQSEKFRSDYSFSMADAKSKPASITPFSMQKTAIPRARESMSYKFAMGTGPETITSDFKSMIDKISDIGKKSNTSATSTSSIADAIIGTTKEKSSETVSKLNAMKAAVESKFTGMSARIKSFAGPLGLFGKFLFGWAGEIAAVLAAMALVANEANASVLGLMANFASSALEAGLIGAMLFGNRRSRTLIFQGLGLASKYLTSANLALVQMATPLLKSSSYAARLLGVFVAIPPIFTGFIGSAIGGLITLSTSVAGIAVAAGVLIYSLGEGNTILERLRDGSGKLGNEMFRMLTGFSSLDSNLSSSNKQLQSFYLTTQKITGELSKLNPDVKAKFEDASKSYSVIGLTRLQSIKQGNLLDKIGTANKDAENDIVATGKVTEATTTKINLLVEKYALLSASIAKSQTTQLVDRSATLANEFISGQKSLISVFDATLLSIHFAGNIFANAVVSVLDSLNATWTTLLPKAFAIEPGFWRGVFEEAQLVMPEDYARDTANKLSDYFNSVVRDGTKLDLSGMVPQVNKAMSDIAFALSEPKILGKDAGLGAYPEAVRNAMTASLASVEIARDKLENLQSKNTIARVLFGDKTGDQVKAEIANARVELEAAVEALSKVASNAAALKNSAIQTKEFQNQVDRVAETLKTLGVTFNKPDLYGADNLSNIEQLSISLGLLQEKLKTVKTTAEGLSVLKQIGIFEFRLKAAVEDNSKKDLISVIENEIKSAGASISAKDLLKLDISTITQVRSKLVDIKRLSDKLNTASFNNDLGAAKQYTGLIEIGMNAVTRAIEAAKVASATLAESLMNIDLSKMTTLSSFYSMSSGDQSRLKTLNETISLAGGQLSMIKTEKDKEGFLGTLIKDSQNELKSALDEREKIIEKYNKKKDTSKKAIPTFEQLLSEAGVSTKVEDIFKSALPMDSLKSRLLEISDASAKLLKVPRSSTGLPIDINDYKAAFNKLAALRKEFDKNFTSESLSDKFNKLFDKIPGILERVDTEDIPAGAIEIASKLADQFEKAANKEFDPKRSLLENFIDFVAARRKIKEGVASIMATIPESFKSKVDATGIDVSSLFLFGTSTAEKAAAIGDNLLKIRKQISEEEGKSIPNLEKIYGLRKDEANELERVKKLPKSFSAALSEAGMSYDVFIKSGVAASERLMTTKLRIKGLEADLAKVSESDSVGRGTLLERLKQQLLIEAGITKQMSRQEEFKSSFLESTKGALSKVFKEGDLIGGFKSFLDSLTTKIVDNFVDQLNTSLFDGLSSQFGDIFGADLFGKKGSEINPMVVRFAASDKVFQSAFSGMGSMFSSAVDGIGSFFGNTFGFMNDVGAMELPLSLGFATGGQVAGAGTGTSDSILARLSNGEFVMNAASTRKYLPVLESMNQGRLPAFAEGGVVSSPKLAIARGNSVSINPAPVSSAQQVVNVNITGDISRQTRSEIYSMLPSIAAGVNSHNREKGFRG